MTNYYIRPIGDPYHPECNDNWSGLSKDTAWCTTAPFAHRPLPKDDDTLTGTGTVLTSGDEHAARTTEHPAALSLLVLILVGATVYLILFYRRKAKGERNV
jgi:hypothetical protein